MECFRSKKELYDFLSQDCKAYLPKIDTTNVYFYKQVARGTKEVSLPLPMAVVYQERLGQTCRSTPDWRPHLWRLPVVCKGKASPAQVFTRRKRLVGSWQKVGVWRFVHTGLGGYWGHDQRSQGKQEGQARGELRSPGWDEARILQLRSKPASPSVLSFVYL